MRVVVDLLGWLLTLLGAGTMLLAAIGLHRFADERVRLHIAAKASSTGILALLFGVAIVSRDAGVAIELALTGVFLVVTVPLATHGLGRAMAPEEVGEQPPAEGAKA